MKKLLFLLVSFSILLLVACGGNENETTTEEKPTTTEEITEEESTDTEEESANTEEDDEKSDVKDTGSRTEPLNLGDTAKINVVTYDDEGEEIKGTAEVIIDNIFRGQEALELMKDEYSEYEAYEDDSYEWVVFDLSYKLVSFDDDDAEFWVGDDIQIYDEEGSPAPNEFATIPNGFEAKELLSGGSLNGKVARPAPKDKPFLIRFDDGVSESAWFKAE